MNDHISSFNQRMADFETQVQELSSSLDKQDSGVSKIEQELTSLNAMVALKSNKASVATALHKKSNKKDVEEWMTKVNTEIKEGQQDLMDKFKVNETEVFDKINK